MKTVFLTRFPSTDQGTFGILVFGTTTCFSVELPWRNNRTARSCIPVGTYTCRITNSPKFGKVYHVENVPGRSAVLIHGANFGGDIDLGYTTHLQGCIAPCNRLGQLRNSKGNMQSAGLVSAPALRTLMTWAASEPFTLEIS